MMSSHVFLRLSVFLGVSLSALCDDVNNVRINNVDDFKTFANEVNYGTTNYYRTTVLLDSDLSLSGKTIEPIGKTSRYQFRGTFDGQGHIISDLKMNISSSEYTGLFEYSTGLTIRNVVLGSSCSITSSYSSSVDVYVGGIIGNCYSRYGECNIENNVNMASVTFNGNIGTGITISYSLHLGGIAGHLYSSNYLVRVKNCANYGSVIHSGISSCSDIGGIVGYFYGSSYKYNCIYNCLNHGAITHSGTSSFSTYLGGIVGWNYYTYIENCVSAGKISTLTTAPEGSSIGSIVGGVSSYTFINYCYYTSELSKYDMYGTGAPQSSTYTLNYDNTTFELSEPVSVGSYTGTSLINALNAAADYYILRDYSHWLLNKEKKSVAFTINSRANTITMDSQVILLPSLASEGRLMFGWYNDDECTNPLETFEVTEDKTLYGRFEENTNKYTITFDTRRGGSYVAPITAQFGATVILPSDVTREHCGVAFWENEYGDNVGLSLTMPAHNFTLYAVWKCTHITSLDDFTDFSKIVNSGTNYSGTTVYLDSDLSLSGETLEPIGKDYPNYFLGVFDGQGHIIDNLKMKTTLKYTGLFGFSKGLTIRNVVLCSSCSITNSFSGSSSVYVGGIIGECYGYDGQCNIENSVNMADVMFSGKVSGSGYSCLYLGGVAGQLESSSNNIYVKNCANYGSVTHSGASFYSYIGGIVGTLYGSRYEYLYNCINYGTITHNGTTSSELHLGGIVGYSSYTFIENCVSAGKISTQTTPSNSYVGSIVGYVNPSTSIIHCYYTSDVGGYPVNGTGEILNATGTPTSATTVNSSLIDNLNNHASSNGWNGWLLNMNNASVVFKVNDYTGFTLNSTLILLPSIISDWRSFTWFSDSSFTTSFSSSPISKSTTLYGRWDRYTVTFDANGGSVSEILRNVTYNSKYGTLPEASRTGHMFVGWFTERTGGSEVTSSTAFTSLSGVTLHAHWLPQYTVTFDVNGGNELTKNKTTVTFNKTYGTLPNASRTGHMFFGWFTENNESITNETIVTITTNHTLHAHWEKVTNQVEIVFNAKDLTKEDVEAIVKKYTDAEFTITELENGSDGTRVIVKFADIEKAEEFAGAILSSRNNDGVKKVRFTFGDDGSFSLLLRPLSLLTMLL